MIETFVVYQVKDKYGYRSIGNQLDYKWRAEMLASSILNSDWGVTQTWILDAESGGKAITKVKRHLKTLAIGKY